MAKGKTVESVSGFDITFDGDEFGIYEGMRHKARCFSDGTFAKPLTTASIRPESIPAKVRAAVKTAMRTVNEQFVAARGEMFPDFASLDSHARRMARLAIMERLGYIDSDRAADKRTAEKTIEARALEMDSRARNEAARRRFDEQ